MYNMDLKEINKSIYW